MAVLGLYTNIGNFLCLSSAGFAAVSPSRIFDNIFIETCPVFRRNTEPKLLYTIFSLQAHSSVLPELSEQ